MKILIAPDSFKETQTSAHAAEAMRAGVLKIFPDAQIDTIPVADGGEGTVESLVDGMGGQIIKQTVTGPLGEKTEAEYGILPGDVGVIEMASASGLGLVPQNRRNPLVTTTRGTGELILDAVKEGCKKIIIGIGGSATNDGGMGMARVLGYRFVDKSGSDIAEGGGTLSLLDKISTSEVVSGLSEITFLVACDVKNPLFGPEGASVVYGPQKGASKKNVDLLDKNLYHLADVVKADMGLDIAETPGAGAAGGLGFGLMAFCGAELKSGIEIILDLVNFDDHLAGVDLVITGEGKIDGQSMYGKVPVGIAGRAKKHDIPVLAIVGGIGSGVDTVYDYGIDSIMSSVNNAMTLEEAMSRSKELLIDATVRAMRIIRIGMKL